MRFDWLRKQAFGFVQRPTWRSQFSIYWTTLCSSNSLIISLLSIEIAVQWATSSTILVVTVVSIRTHSFFYAVLRNPFAFAFIFLLDYIGPAIAIATAIAIHFAIERLVYRSVFFVETVYLLQVCCKCAAIVFAMVMVNFQKLEKRNVEQYIRSRHCFSQWRRQGIGRYSAYNVCKVERFSFKFW